MPRAGRRSTLAAIAIAALACNNGLAPRIASGSCPAGFVGICGTVEVRGAIPDSTDFVIIVAFEQFPQSTNDLFSFKPAQDQLALGGTSAIYQLPLAPGRYEWVLAVWKKLGNISPTNADSLLREAGFYEDPAAPGQPGAVTVVGSVNNLDFVVDFDAMHAVSFWFPAAPSP